MNFSILIDKKNQGEKPYRSSGNVAQFFRRSASLKRKVAQQRNPIESIA